MAESYIIPNELSSSEASAAEIISKMSEYQFIAVVQDGGTCEAMEQVIDEKGEPVEVNSSEYYQTVGEPAVVDLAFDDISSQMKEESHVEKIIEEGIDVSEESTNFIINDIVKQENTRVLISDDDRSPPPETSTVVSAIDDDDLKIRSILVPLGMKMSSTEKLTREKRKRVKSTLFIGYTHEAAEVLKEFESLKEELEIQTNTAMLRKLIQNMRKDIHSSPATGDVQAVSEEEKNAKALLQLFEDNKNSDGYLPLTEQTSVSLLK